MELINIIDKFPLIDITLWKKIIKLIAPFAPFMTEELWNIVGENFSVHEQSFPSKYRIKEEQRMKIIVAINGKKRGEIELNPDTEINEIVSKARVICEKYGITEHTKFKYVEDKIINFII